MPRSRSGRGKRGAGRRAKPEDGGQAVLDALAAGKPVYFVDERGRVMPPPERAPTGPLALDAVQITELRRLPHAAEEWLGGRRPLHAATADIGGLPDMIVWMNEGAELLLGGGVVPPAEGDEALLETLCATMAEPGAGQPRRPTRVLLEDARAVGRLGAALAPLGIVVHASAVRWAEIDEVVARFEAYAAAEPDEVAFAGYLAYDVVPEEVACFFRAAARLHRAAPWEIADDEQVLAVDLDRWGVKRLCVSVIGKARVARGLLIFESLDAFLGFADLAAQPERGAGFADLAAQPERGAGFADLAAQAEHGPPPNRGSGLTTTPPQRGESAEAPGVTVLALNFEEARDIGPTARDEVRDHGWEPAAVDVYPVLLRMAPNNVALPLSATDYRVATACADAVGVFVRTHAALFEEGGADASESEALLLPEWPGDPRVVVTAPHPGPTRA